MPQLHTTGKETSEPVGFAGGHDHGKIGQQCPAFVFGRGLESSGSPKRRGRCQDRVLHGRKQRFSAARKSQVHTKASAANAYQAELEELSEALSRLQPLHATGLGAQEACFPPDCSGSQTRFAGSAHDRATHGPRQTPSLYIQALLERMQTMTMNMASSGSAYQGPGASTQGAGVAENLSSLAGHRTRQAETASSAGPWTADPSGQSQLPDIADAEAQMRSLHIDKTSQAFASDGPASKDVPFPADFQPHFPTEHADVMGAKCGPPRDSFQRKPGFVQVIPGRDSKPSDRIGSHDGIAGITARFHRMSTTGNDPSTSSQFKPAAGPSDAQTCSSASCPSGSHQRDTSEKSESTEGIPAPSSTVSESCQEYPLPCAEETVKGSGISSQPSKDTSGLHERDHESKKPGGFNTTPGTSRCMMVVCVCLVWSDSRGVIVSCPVCLPGAAPSAEASFVFGRSQAPDSAAKVLPRRQKLGNALTQTKPKSKQTPSALGNVPVGICNPARQPGESVQGLDKPSRQSPFAEHQPQGANASVAKPAAGAAWEAANGLPGRKQEQNNASAPEARCRPAADLGPGLSNVGQQSCAGPSVGLSGNGSVPFVFTAQDHQPRARKASEDPGCPKDSNSFSGRPVVSSWQLLVVCGATTMPRGNILITSQASRGTS